MAPSHLMDKKVRESSSFIHKYCRMCALEIKQGVFIFGEEGKRLHIPEKIRRTLAILVLEEDTLPKKICTDCCSSLEDYAQYKNTVLDAQEKLTYIAKSLLKSESRQRLHKLESSNYEESVISSSESISDEETNTSCKRTPVLERHKEPQSRRNVTSDKIAVKCGICGELFTDDNKLMSHYGEKHSSLKHQSPIMQCSNCPKISLNYRDICHHFLRNHRDSNTDSDFKVSTYHSCKQCGKRYHSHTELMLHVKAKHHKAELPTSPASSVSPSSVVSTQDILDDDDIPPEVQSTASPASVSEEMSVATDYSPTNNTPGHSSAVINTINTPKCPEKESPEANRDSLHRDSHHLKRQSEQPLTEQPITTPVASTSQTTPSKGNTADENSSSLHRNRDTMPRRCDICDKFLKSRAGYINHMMTHEGRRFECKDCGVSYTQKTALDTHIKVHHLNAPKKFSCSVCAKKFIDFKALNRHQKIHSEPSLEFQCSFCQKTYTTDVYLQRHVRRHTQPPRHLCPTCGKAFFQKRKLDDHMHTHSGEKTEGCPFCHKAFGSYSNYERHVKKNHASALGDGNKIPSPKKIVAEDVRKDSSSAPVTQPSQSSKPTNLQVSPQTQTSPPTASQPQPQNNSLQNNQNSSPLVVPIPQPQIQEAHQHSIAQTPVAQDYHESPSEPAHSSSYQIAHQSSWTQVPASTGKNYQNPSGGSTTTTSSNNSASTINALDLVDCAIHHALGSEGNNGNSSNAPPPPPPSSQHNHHSSHQQLHGNNPSVLSIVHHQSEPMELSYKLDSNPNSFQDMPMELTKVFQRDPLELCVRQDFNNPLMDLSSRVVENGNMGMISGISMNNMNMNGVCGMGMGMTTNSYHKLDLTDREFQDMGAFRQPIDLISRADDGHQLCSEGNLVDLSLRSTFGQEQCQSASSFLRELIDLSARSDSFHGGELDLTKHPHQHHHSVSTHHSQHQHQHQHHQSHHHSSSSGSGGKALNSTSMQHAVYSDSIFSLPN